MKKGDPGYVQAIIDQKAYNLTFDQQDFIKKSAADLSLLELVQKTFKEDSLDERSIEYDSVRKFVAKVKRDVSPLEFTEDQLQFIENNSHSMGPLELAKNLFPKNKVVPLSKETKTIALYLKAIGVGSGEEDDIDEYKPPKAAASIVRKINGAVPNAFWDANDLSPFQKKCVESMKGYLQSIRVSSFMRICPPEFRPLFEEELIKATHDKYDLNSEELNMFISLCMEYVNIDQQTYNKNILEAKIAGTLAESEDGKKLYMTWVDLLEKREADLHKSKERATKLQEKLSSTRSARLKDMAAVNESLTKFVEEWKSEEGRRRAIIIAEARALELKDEINRIKTAEEYIANVMGIGEDEILRY